MVYQRVKRRSYGFGRRPVKFTQMQTKVFSATPEVVERMVNHWLGSRDGPAELLSMTQSQCMRQSGNVELTVFVLYKAKATATQP